MLTRQRASEDEEPVVITRRNGKLSTSEDAKNKLLEPKKGLRNVTNITDNTSLRNSKKTVPAQLSKKEPAPVVRTRSARLDTRRESQELVRVVKTKRSREIDSAAQLKQETPKKQRIVNSLSRNDPDAPLEPLTTPKDKISRIQTPKTPSSVFQEAKAAFRRCATPSRLIGRIKERQALVSFLEHHALKAVPGSLYISGCPGTGKTALLNEVCKAMTPEFQKAKHKIVQMTFNCMSVSDAKSIYSKLVSEITGQSSSQKDAMAELQKLLMPKKSDANKIYLLILDEIDQLVTSDNSVLYNLFEWATKKDSRLVLIGIANALDLTDRFLPRLKAKGCAPTLINFNPYQVSEITAIIKDRLMSVSKLDCELEEEAQEAIATNSVPLMQPMAIEIAARKIANTGDLRKALDVCRKALELLESESKAAESNNETQNSNPNMKSPGFDSPIASLDEIPKVSIRHIISATTAFSGTPNTNKIKDLHANQKMILVCMMILSDKLGKQQPITKLFEGYTKICRFNNYVPVTAVEFNELITVLENAGLITFKTPKSGRESISIKTACMNVRHEEIEKACADSQLLSRVLQNGASALKSKK